MMQLYGYPGSRSLRVAWTLEELEAEYEYIKLDLMKGEGRKPEYLKLNPGGKVPTLADMELVLTESAAICNYLADKYPEAGLISKHGTAGRALHDQWCYFALTELEQPLWTLAKHSFILPEALRAPDIFKTTEYEFITALDVLKEGLGEKDYILGNTFTVADILIAYVLNWAKQANMPLKHESIERYAERCLSRPAFERAKTREQEGRSIESV